MHPSRSHHRKSDGQGARRLRAIWRAAVWFTWMWPASLVREANGFWRMHGPRSRRRLRWKLFFALATFLTLILPRAVRPGRWRQACRSGVVVVWWPGWLGLLGWLGSGSRTGVPLAYRPALTYRERLWDGLCRVGAGWRRRLPIGTLSALIMGLGAVAAPNFPNQGSGEMPGASAPSNPAPGGGGGTGTAQVVGLDEVASLPPEAGIETVENISGGGSGGSPGGGAGTGSGGGSSGGGSSPIELAANDFSTGGGGGGFPSSGDPGPTNESAPSEEGAPGNPTTSTGGDTGTSFGSGSGGGGGGSGGGGGGGGGSPGGGGTPGNPGGTPGNPGPPTLDPPPLIPPTFEPPGEPEGPIVIPAPPGGPPAVVGPPDGPPPTVPPFTPPTGPQPPTGGDPIPGTPIPGQPPVFTPPEGSPPVFEPPVFEPGPGPGGPGFNPDPGPGPGPGPQPPFNPQPPRDPGPEEPSDSQLGAVPEPATWVMLILGFGAAGAALRRRRPATAA